MATPIEILDAIRTCYCELLPDEVSCCISSGEPVVASCCPGQAWVRVVNINPVGQDQQYSPCGPVMWRMQVELGISRCAPDECGPTDPMCCVSEEIVAFDLLADRVLMLRAVACCTDPIMLEVRKGITYGAWEITGPEGGCVDATQQVFIQFIDSCAC